MGSDCNQFIEIFVTKCLGLAFIVRPAHSVCPCKFSPVIMCVVPVNKTSAYHSVIINKLKCRAKSTGKSIIGARGCDECAECTR